jgi:hypothetical protein
MKKRAMAILFEKNLTSLGHSTGTPGLHDFLFCPTGSI